MKPQPADEQSTTHKSSALIRKFLALEAEMHRRELTPMLISSYEILLGDVPVDELRAALRETLRVETFWPTPGHIKRKLDDIACRKANAPAHDVWRTPDDWVVEEDTREERAEFARSLRQLWKV